MIYDISPEKEEKECETTSRAENADPDILEAIIGFFKGKEKLGI